jgi:hypothetical protein
MCTASCDRQTEIQQFIQWCRQPYVEVFNVTPERADELAREYFTPVRILGDAPVYKIIEIMRSSINQHSTHGRLREWQRCCIGVAEHLLAGNLDNEHRVGAAGALVRLSGWSNTCVRFYKAFYPAATGIATIIWGQNIPYLKIGEEYDASAIRIDETLLDEEGYMTLWQFAEGRQTEMIGSPKKDQETRALASRVLNFMCLHDYDDVEISPVHFQFIRSRFSPDRSKHILYRWSVGSRFVDVIAQHIRVPAYGLLDFLTENGFDPDLTYNPEAQTRLFWFKRWKQADLITVDSS